MQFFLYILKKRAWDRAYGPQFFWFLQVCWMNGFQSSFGKKAGGRTYYRAFYPLWCLGNFQTIFQYPLVERLVLLQNNPVAVSVSPPFSESSFKAKNLYSISQCFQIILHHRPCGRTHSVEHASIFDLFTCNRNPN